MQLHTDAVKALTFPQKDDKKDYGDFGDLDDESNEKDMLKSLLEDIGFDGGDFE